MMPTIHSYTKRALLLYIAVMFVTACCAQSDEQSLVDSLQRQLQHTQSPMEQAYLMAQLSMKLSNITPGAAVQMALKGAAIARNIKDDKGIAYCFESAGWCYYKVGKADSAKDYLQKAKDIFHQLQLYSEEAKTVVNLSSIYQNEENDEKALGYLLTAETLFDSSHDQVSKAYTENLIGNSYRKLGIYDKANLYTDDAIATFSTLKADPYLADALSSKGNLFVAMKNWDSAFVYYNECMDVSRRMGHKITLAYGYEDKAELFLAINDDHPTPRYLDSALDCYQQAYTLFLAFGGASDIAYERLNIGKTLILLGKYTAAKDYLNKALAQFITDQSYDYAYKAATHLSELYQDEKDYKNALDYLDRSLAYKDSTTTAEQKKTMDDLLVKYETDKKDKAIQLLNTQNELTDKELSKNRLILVFSLGLTLLLIIIGLILRAQNRIRQQLKEVQMRHQIASDLHDDVGSSLSSILLLSNMAAQQTGDNILLDKIGINTKEVIDKMTDIVWTMKPENDEGTSLKEKLEKLGLLIRDISGIPVTMDISDKLEALKLTMDTRKNVFLICKEAMNNVLKHAEATAIYFSVDIFQRDILVTVKDNGKGFDKAIVKKNNGMQTMAQRARDCGGTCMIEATPEAGTTVTVKIPIPRSRYRFS